MLRWRRLSFSVLLQRLLITASATLMVVAIARWLVNPSEQVWLVYRSVQVFWQGGLVAWSLLLRIGLRRGLLLPDAPRLCCSQLVKRCGPCSRLGPEEHRVSVRAYFPPRFTTALNEGSAPLLVALSPRCSCDPSLSGLIERLGDARPSLGADDFRGQLV